MECLVYGARAGTNAATFANSYQSSVINRQLQDRVGAATRDALTDNRKLKTDNSSIEAIKAAIRETLWENVSIERNGEGLAQTLAELQDLAANLGNVPANPESKDIALIETVNMLDVALMITRSALTRTESRGAHYRADFPTQDDTNWHRRILITRDNLPEMISLEE